jgi:Large polyvalent protein associated domain 38
MADDYYPPTDDEPQQQPQSQPQPPPGFIPYQPEQQEASSPPAGFIPYRPEPPPGFIPYRPQAQTAQTEAPPAPPIKSAPEGATDEERRTIYGDEPLGTPPARGGLSPTAGSTVTSTTPVQDIPAPKVNKAGETLPTYIFREMGKGIASLPQRATEAAGELQRQGDVYRPDAIVETVLMGYGARSLAGAVLPRPGAMAPRPVPSTAGTPPRPTVPEPPAFRPPVTPEGQYQFSLDAQHQLGLPLQRGRGEAPPRQLPLELEGGASGGTRQAELPLEGDLGKQGQTPGSTASAGVAQDPLPPASQPVADAQNKATLGTGAMETGGENLNTRDYGKATPGATGEGSGVNVLKDGVDTTLAHALNPNATPEVPPVRQATAEPGLLPEKQPLYDAAKAAAPNLSPEQLTHIANLAGGPKGAALMARNAARRLAEDTGAAPTVGDQLKAQQAARTAERAPEPERAPVPEGTMELPTVEVKPDTAPTPEAVTQATEAAAQTAATKPEPALGLDWQAKEGAGGGKKTAPMEATAANGDVYGVQPAKGLKGWEVTRNGHVIERGRSKIDAVRQAERISQLPDLPTLPPRAVEQQLPAPGSKAAQRAEAEAAVAEFEARKKGQGVSYNLATPEGRAAQAAAEALPAEPARPSRPSTDYTGKLNPDISHTEYVNRLQELRDNKPRPINKLWNNPDLAPPERVAAAREDIKAWDREYRAVNRNQKLALERDNAAYRMEAAKRGEQPVAPTTKNLLTDEAGGGRLPTFESVVEAARAVGKSVAEFLKDERGGLRIPRTPAEEKVLSRRAPEPGIFDDVPKNKAEAASAWRKFYAGFKNEADAFEQLKHRSLTPVAPEVDPGILARLIKGLGGRINQVLEDGTYSVRTRQVTGDPLRTVMDKIAHDPDGFDAYAMARTTVERDAYGVKTGIGLAEANQVIAQSGAKWGPILAELNAWKGRMLDTAVDILGPKAVDAMKNKYPGHIALHRMLDPASPTAGMLGGGMQARNPLHRLGKGNEDLKILNVRDSTIKDGIALLDMAERNRVGMAMEDLNNKLGHNSKFMREVKDMHPVDISAAEVNKHLGVEGITEQVADGFKVFRKDAFHPAPDRIRVFRDGKSKVYEVDPELGKAFHALEYHSFGMLTKILSVPAKMLRAGSVLIPEFIIKNLFRDQIAAFAQAKGFIPGVDTAMGLKNLFPGKSSEAFQRWQIEGGANASMISLDRKLFHEDPRTILQHTANVVTSPYHFLQMMSEVAENATRLGVYERAIKGGAHPIEATYAAREGTLDFQRVGGWAIQKALNQIIPFYNVALEGTDRTLRALFTGDRKLVTSMKMVAGITVPSLYIWAATKDDERIQQLPRWRKDVAWNIPGKDNWQPISTGGRNEIIDGMLERFPGMDTSKLTNTFRQAKDGSWEYNRGIIWALPKPPGVGQLFGSIPERMLDAYVQHDPNAFKELGKTMWQAFAPSIVPQAALPEIERWANKSFFLDRTLVSPALQKLPTSQQYGPQTSEVAKTIAAGIRSIAGDKTSLGAPIMVDNYIRAWSGGMGKYITDMIDLGLRDKDAPVKPAWSASDVPVLKGLVARFPSADAQAIQQFYDTYEERKQATAGIRNLQKKGLPEDPALLRENPIQGIHNALGAGFKTVRNITENKNMSAEEKRTAMDLTYLFMIEKAKQGIKALEESKRKATPPPNFIPYRPEMQ